jgi:integrase/recombinase XerC
VHNSQPLKGLRNHALLAVLLGSGLRVSEALGLDREQYTGRGFVRVQVKGGMVRDFVPLQREGRKVLADWLETRDDEATPPLSRALADGSPAAKLPGLLSAWPRRRTGGYRTTNT